MSFQTALSGLNAAQSNLGVTGNNIANASTTGFKKSRTEFGDIYASSSFTTSVIGAGVQVKDIRQQFTQGNVEFTDNTLDLAITGEGFFVLRDSDGTPQYTRAGAFGIDREGYVVNSQGQRLQKLDVDDNGVVSNFSLDYTGGSDLRLQTSTSPAVATTATELNLNLNTVDAIPAVAFDPTDPDSYNFSTSTTIYDSLGVSHVQTSYFVKTAANTWDAYLYVTDGSTGVQSAVGTETLSFNPDGSLATAMPLSPFGGAAPNFTPASGANPMTLSLDLTGSTQFAGESAVNSVVQDGFGIGRISGIDIDATGVVFARYTNGQSELMGALAMAKFANPEGLRPVGNSNWAATFDAGDDVLGQAGYGTFGDVQAGALESSNVDISKQLVNMIIAQRDFQANAKMISTEDTVTQTLINIR